MQRGCLLALLALLAAILFASWLPPASSSSPPSSAPRPDTIAASGVDWSPVLQVLSDQLAAKTFPGAVAAVLSSQGLVFLRAVGSYAYDTDALPPFRPPGFETAVPAMTPTTRFDLASLTKVLATTTAVMTLYQRGLLRLDDSVASSSLLTSRFAVGGKAQITVRNLLLHNAGFPPDPEPNYWDPAFGCAGTLLPFPPEDFACRELIFESLLNQTLANPVGQVYVYSDLSMITMMYIVGRVARDAGLVNASNLHAGCVAGQPTGDAGVDGSLQCYYEAYVRVHVLDRLELFDTGFLPSAADYAKIAPTWNDTWYRHIQLQGVVSDGNAYALGGIAGHAGLFSHAVDIAALLHSLMFAPADSPWINATTVATFTRVYNSTQSSRALGWDTNIDLTCGNLSSQTYTHTGYTGTQVCNDPVLGISTILLTNRCYPDDSAQSKTQIAAARQQFSSAVRQVLEAHTPFFTARK